MAEAPALAGCWGTAACTAALRLPVTVPLARGTCTPSMTAAPARAGLLGRATAAVAAAAAAGAAWRLRLAGGSCRPSMTAAPANKGCLERTLAALAAAAAWRRPGSWAAPGPSRPSIAAAPVLAGCWQSAGTPGQTRQALGFTVMSHHDPLLILTASLS
jgi:hypothetical protein